MSATAAPLTPADITALLGDGWRCREESWRHIWTSRDVLFKQVELSKLFLTVLVTFEDESGDTHQDVWKVPSPTKHRAVTVLTLAGLIPGQVSVTQPREPALQIIDRRAGTTEPAEWADRCRNCGEHAVTWVEFTHRPEVCSCSTETRPTMADPCREQVVSLSCLRCAPLFDPSLLPVLTATTEGSTR